MLRDVNTLVLSGGGVKGISILGALHYLSNETKYLNCIQTYSGTSIGAVICILLSVGYTPLEIFSKLHFIENILETNISAILQIHERFGLASNESFIDIILNLVQAKFPQMWTLGELYQLTQKTVYVCVVNLSREEVMYISHLTHPDMPIHLVLRMSCNLPGIFTKITWNDELYVDGGVVDNLPLQPVDVEGNVILSLRLNRDAVKKADDIGFIEYFYRIASLGSRFYQTTMINSIHHELHHFTLTNKDCNVVGLHMTLEEKRVLFDEGYEQLNYLIIDKEMDESEEWGK